MQNVLINFWIDYFIKDDKSFIQEHIRTWYVWKGAILQSPLREAIKYQPLFICVQKEVYDKKKIEPNMI